MDNHGDGRAIRLYAGKAQLLKMLCLNRLFFPRPIPLVNDKGIFSDPLSLWFVKMKMSMRWEEIEAMYLQELTLRGTKETKTYHLLCILPKDFAGFVEREQLGGRGRFAVVGTMTVTGTPFMIGDKNIIPHSLEGLLNRICDGFQEEIQVHGIEIRDKLWRQIGGGDEDGAGRARM